MNRRGFLYSLGSAVMAVAMDVLPKFAKEPIKLRLETAEMVVPEAYNYGQIIRSPFGLSGRVNL